MSADSRRISFVLAALIACVVFLGVVAAVVFLLKGDQPAGEVVGSWHDSAYSIPTVKPATDCTPASSRVHPDQVGRQDGPSVAAPKNVILVIGDGMGLGQISTASTLLNGPSGGLSLEQAPITGLTRPQALNNLIVDSASSGTAIATGFRTNNTMVGMLPDGRRIKNLLEAARGRSMATAVITTSYLMDATPACFTAHTNGRKKYPEILQQMIDSDADILIGGSSKIPLDGGGDTDMAAVVSIINDPSKLGFTLVRTEEELATASGRILGLFPSRNGDPSFHGPQLKVSTGKMLEVLAAHPSGFAAVIESEITDEAGHSNDVTALVEGVRELDEAIRSILDFADQRGDTLVLVLADHSTGVPAIVKGKVGGTEISWVSRHHTAHWLPVFAFGPGAEAFSGVFNQAQIAPTIATLMGFEDYPAIMPDA